MSWEVVLLDILKLLYILNLRYVPDIFQGRKNIIHINFLVFLSEIREITLIFKESIHFLIPCILEENYNNSEGHIFFFLKIHKLHYEVICK